MASRNNITSLMGRQVFPSALRRDELNQYD